MKIPERNYEEKKTKNAERTIEEILFYFYSFACISIPIFHQITFQFAIIWLIRFGDSSLSDLHWLRACFVEPGNRSIALYVRVIGESIAGGAAFRQSYRCDFLSKPLSLGLDSDRRSARILSDRMTDWSVL